MQQNSGGGGIVLQYRQIQQVAGLRRFDIVLQRRRKAFGFRKFGFPFCQREIPQVKGQALGIFGRGVVIGNRGGPAAGILILLFPAAQQQFPI